MRKTNRTLAAYAGIFTALAMILSYIESLLPLFYGIPGVKLGLANSMSLLTLYVIGPGAALLVMAVRVVLSGILFGNVFSIIYSLAGGTVSLLLMIALRRSGLFSMTGISMGGGIAHNIAQLAVAALLVENLNLFYYLPVLLISGVVTGFLVGMISSEVWKRLPSGLRADMPPEHEHPESGGLDP